MPIATNELIQQAYESLGMTGLGESTDGNMAVVGLQQLNRAIAKLNSEGYLSMMQKFIDVPASREIHFRKLFDGEISQPHSVDMEPPEKVEAVARRIGDHFIPLASCDSVQMSMKTPLSLPRSWNYGRDFEEVPAPFATLGNERREVGVLRMDGISKTPLRVWLNAKIPAYTLDDTIYLSDIYNELVSSALRYRLAQFYELSESKKSDCYADLTAAKNLIKRNNATQRMLRSGILSGSWDDAYFNGFAPSQW